MVQSPSGSMGDPVLRNPERLRAGVERVRRGAIALRQGPWEQRWAALDRVRRAWIEPGSRWLERAAHEVAETTGFHPEMIRHGLPLHFQPVNSAAIRELFEEELGGPWLLQSEDSFVPTVVIAVLAGNLPGLAVWPTFLALAGGIGVVLKPAAGDPRFPYLLFESVRDLAPDLAEAMWVLSWRGGNRAVEDVVFAEADLVVAQGADTTVAELSNRVAARFVGYGSRVSLAVVGRGVLDHPAGRSEAAHALAYDVTLWDQRGCLSPHVCLVRCDSERELDEFALELAAALDKWARTLPPRRLSVGELSEVRQFREEAGWSGSRVVGSEVDFAWSVAVEPTAQLRPTCGHRCVRLQPLRSYGELLAVLANGSAAVEAVGLAMTEQERGEVAALLRSAGVVNVVRLGEMQKPTLRWKPGGRPRVAEWFRAGRG